MLLTAGTVEEKIDRLLMVKRDLAARVVGAGERWITELDDAALGDLLALSGDAVVTTDAADRDGEASATPRGGGRARAARRPEVHAYPPPAKKLPPPAHGIKVKEVGATWWGRRWIEALERLSAQYANRMARGRTYARAGRVHDLVVGVGSVRARVTGSRRTPYVVTFKIAALPPATWAKAVEEMAKQALFSAQLLAGDMPAAFRRAGASLFPSTRRDLATDCSCPDVANPCKHVAATHCVLGEAFDKDPFLLFELRGRAKADVLNSLRRARAAAAGGPAPRAAAAAGRAAPRAAVLALIPTVSLDRAAAESYDRARAPLAGLRFRIEAPAAHAVTLRGLGPPASWSLAESVAELLGPAYEAAGSLARELALAREERPAAELALDQ